MKICLHIPFGIRTRLRNSFTNIGKEDDTNLFAFHLQSINPALPCPVAHVYPTENGKGRTNRVSTLLRLRDILQTQFHFRIVALTFDGDPCFNTFPDDFASLWRGRLTRQPASILAG
jgi:hypothetical protein